LGTAIRRQLAAVGAALFRLRSDALSIRDAALRDCLRGRVGSRCRTGCGSLVVSPSVAPDACHRKAAQSV